MLRSLAEELQWTDPKLLLSLLVIFGVWLLRKILLRALDDRDVDPANLYRWRKNSAYIGFFFVVAVICSIWAHQFRSLGTFLGLLSAGLAIALRELIMGIAGWMFILTRRPFVVGDRIEVGSFRGDVIDIRLFKFSLMEIGGWVAADQSTGRVVHVPNGLALSDVVVNYTRGFEYLWNEIPVMVTFESDWQRTKELLQEIADEVTGGMAEEARASLRRAASGYLLHYRNLTPTVYTHVADSGVVLTVRHLTPPRRRRGVTEAISEGILKRFAEEPNIELAYPTLRYYRSRQPQHVAEPPPDPEPAP